MLSESHTVSELRSSMDQVKASFVKKMKVSSTSRQITSTRVSVTDFPLSTAVKRVPLFAKVTCQGWAIPRVKTFRYSYEQKKFLYDIFMEGETSGKKINPDEAELRVRQHFLSTKDYVTSKQIRSLFHNFTRQLKDNTLVEPTPSLVEKSRMKSDDRGCASVAPSVELVEDLESDDHADEVLMQVTEDIMADISTWDEGTWVVVRNRRKWLPGQIVSCDSADIEKSDNSFAVDCMEGNRGNKFRWPQSRDIRLFDKCDILLEITDVTPIAAETMTGGDIVWCQLDKTDYDDANQALRRYLREDCD